MSVRSNRKDKVTFVAGFKPRSLSELTASLGQFPWNQEEKKKAHAASLNNDGIVVKNLDQLDEICYYSNMNKDGSCVWQDLPEPTDEGCWLANFVEAGQTFDEYVSFVSLRSGKLKPSSHVGKPIIYLLPITNFDGAEVQGWPSGGPDLRHLTEWIQAFYERDVVILDPVSLSVVDPTTIIPGQSKKRKQEYAGQCKIAFRTPTYESYIEGRVADDNAHFQTHIDGLLSEITAIRTEGIHTYSPELQLHSVTASSVTVDLTEEDNVPKVCQDTDTVLKPQRKKVAIHDAFAVIGISMLDLYSSEEDLFIAGMAAGGSKTAVLSFARYHPRIRMHFQNWFDYGYVSKSAEYSYFEEGEKRPSTAEAPPNTLDATSQANFLRRAGKLVVHELAHVYGIDHCVHYHCVMNGTGHLVEDFAAPAHLCGICLRKLQFRMGFDVLHRYQRLLKVYTEGGLTKEAKWVQKRLRALNA